MSRTLCTGKSIANKSYHPPFYMRMHIPMGRMVSVGERLSQFGVEYSNRSSRRGQPAQCVDKIQTNSVIVTLIYMLSSIFRVNSAAVAGFSSRRTEFRSGLQVVHLSPNLCVPNPAPPAARPVQICTKLRTLKYSLNSRAPITWIPPLFSDKSQRIHP